MDNDTAVAKNLDLLDAFMQYAFKRPGILDKIPPGAELVILPDNDPEMREENIKFSGH